MLKSARGSNSWTTFVSKAKSTSNPSETFKSKTNNFSIAANSSKDKWKASTPPLITRQCMKLWSKLLPFATRTGRTCFAPKACWWSIERRDRLSKKTTPASHNRTSSSKQKNSSWERLPGTDRADWNSWKFHITSQLIDSPKVSEITKEPKIKSIRMKKN